MGEALILDVQRDALDHSVPVSHILRKAAVAASKLDLAADAQWIRRELIGFADEDELPPHRVVPAVLTTRNPYHGDHAVRFEDAKLHDAAHRVHITQAMAEIEKLAKAGTELKSDASRQAQQLGIKLPTFYVISPTALIALVDTVRQLVLDWTLGLEKRRPLETGAARPRSGMYPERRNGPRSSSSDSTAAHASPPRAGNWWLNPGKFLCQLANGWSVSFDVDDGHVWRLSIAGTDRDAKAQWDYERGELGEAALPAAVEDQLRDILRKLSPPVGLDSLQSAIIENVVTESAERGYQKGSTLRQALRSEHSRSAVRGATSRLCPRYLREIHEDVFEPTLAGFSVSSMAGAVEEMLANTLVAIRSLVEKDTETKVLKWDFLKEVSGLTDDDYQLANATIRGSRLCKQYEPMKWWEIPDLEDISDCEDLPALLGYFRGGSEHRPWPSAPMAPVSTGWQELVADDEPLINRMPVLQPGGLEDRMTSKTLSLLFLDLAGWSKLSMDEIRRYVQEGFPSVAATVKAREPVHTNTWGDAIVATFDSTLTAANCALDLRQQFQRATPADGIPVGLVPRIALHTGEVLLAENPIIERQDVFGSTVHLAARLEPATRRGAVYCTEKFASHLKDMGELAPKAHSVGEIELPKGFGRFEVFEVRGPNEDPPPPLPDSAGGQAEASDESAPSSEMRSLVAQRQLEAIDALMTEAAPLHGLILNINRNDPATHVRAQQAMMAYFQKVESVAYLFAGDVANKLSNYASDSWRLGARVERDPNAITEMTAIHHELKATLRRLVGVESAEQK